MKHLVLVALSLAAAHASASDLPPPHHPLRPGMAPTIRPASVRIDGAPDPTPASNAAPRARADEDLRPSIHQYHPGGRGDDLRPSIHQYHPEGR